MSTARLGSASFKYAGIGSRETPDDVLDLMGRFAFDYMDDAILRSGHAPGADLAFEQGVAHGMCWPECDDVERFVEIYLPWRSFNKEASVAVRPRLNEPTPEAMEVAAEYHPAWQYLKPAVKKLMARNAHQVLGANLDDPVDFVVCWTPDGSLDGQGKKVGGTGQALRIAHDYGIEVWNLALPSHFALISAMTS